MYLFIFESIGTSELLLIGIVALIFLGPRKMPEMARKIGKLMSDFRSTTNEFKETWQREVNFEDETSLWKESPPTPVPRALETAQPPVSELPPPAVDEAPSLPFTEPAVPADPPSVDDPNDKRNWL